MLRGPGELSFEARVGDRSTRILFRTESPVNPNADAALATCLMPAMASGGTLELLDPISPRILRTQLEFQTVQRAWSLDWPSDYPALQGVDVIAPTRVPEAAGGNGRVAAFFSGGVDSWSSVLGNPDLTDLIFVRGLDLVSHWDHQGDLADRVEARLRDTAEELGLHFHVVETNLRELSDPVVRWEIYFGCAVTAVALFLQPLFERVLIATDSDYEVQPKMGGSLMVDQLFSTESLEIVEDGNRFSRVERSRRIAGHPAVQRSLRVCWKNPDGAYNCGHCRKCLLTMITLEALGALDRIETFPSELDLSDAEEIEISIPLHLSLWEDVLDTVRAAGRQDLEPTVEAVVARGKQNLGLSRDFRTRKAPGPPPLATPQASNGERSPEEAAELLADVLASRSWRLTEPLRRGGALLRRMRGLK